MNQALTNTTVGVIPARFHSTRLPGKALADIAGRPMIEHVYRRASRVRGLDAVFVATDDVRIFEVVQAFGGEAVMTSSDCATGSDRVWEAIQGREAGIVVNIQGDEPLLDIGAIEAMIEAFGDPSVEVVTAVAPHSGESQEAGVFVRLDERGVALDFSRADSGAPWRHLGLYAYRWRALESFAMSSQGKREMEERLEQLRFLEYGVPVHVVKRASLTPSVDTPEDLLRVRELVAS
jgi:3-deoxy-manno-octulosonate cytidylyltransferase (CMP-KDO synthetase)